MRWCTSIAGGLALLLSAAAAPGREVPVITPDDRSADVAGEVGAATGAVPQPGNGLPTPEPRNLQMQLVTDLQRLQSEMRSLRGTVDENARLLRRLEKRQRDLYVDLDNRLLALEQSGSGAAESDGPRTDDDSRNTDAAANVSAPDEPSASSQRVQPPVALERAPERTQSNASGGPPQPDPKPSQRPSASASAAEPADSAAASRAEPKVGRAMYDAAFERLKQGEYDAAIADFRRFLNEDPGHDLADNAQYWIGEAYYVTRSFDKAKTEFGRVIENHPRSAKVADATLKLGYIEDEQGRRAEAVKLLRRVREQWPDSSAARLATARLEQIQ